MKKRKTIEINLELNTSRISEKNKRRPFERYKINNLKG